PGGASRLAALLLPHIFPICSVVAPCQPGAALRKVCRRASEPGHETADDASRHRRASTHHPAAALSRRPHADLPAESGRLESRTPGLASLAAGHRRRASTAHHLTCRGDSLSAPLVAPRPSDPILPRR